MPAPARDCGISRATGYRYDGMTHLVLDGNLFPTHRLGEQTTSVKGEQIDAWYSGEHREPGGNVKP